MKKIRIDYYNYRLRKGQAAILLERVEETGKYRIPCHYVWADERLGRGLREYKIEDDGDLVLMKVMLNELHPYTAGKEWIPLNKVRELSICRDESLHVSHNIFRFMLNICPGEGESGLKRRVSDMLETLKVDKAKKAYIDELRCFLEGEGLHIPGSVAKQPDRELVRREMETLEHFRLHKPNPISMNLWDRELKDKDEYSYESVNW